MHIFAFLLFAVVSLPALAEPTPQAVIESRDEIETRSIFEFNPGTWVHNIAIRHDGKILTTFLTSPELLLVDQKAKNSPRSMYIFPNATCLLGIAEHERDIYYVISGTCDPGSRSFVRGSSSIWRVEMKDNGYYSPIPVKVYLVSDFPDTQFLNGITPYTHGTEKDLLVSDSIAGVVYIFSPPARAFTGMINDPLMKGAEGPTGTREGSPFGVSELIVKDSVLYFSNPHYDLIASQPLNRNGTPKEAAEVLVGSQALMSGFTLGRGGEFFVAQASSLGFAPKSQHGVISVARNVTEPVLHGATTVRFGRNLRDRKHVYVGTNGGLDQYLTGNLVEGGKIASVKVHDLL